MSQISLENTYSEVFFNKFADVTGNYITKVTPVQVLSCDFWITYD